MSLEAQTDLRAADRRTVEGLKKRVCGVCDFHRDGCDFIQTDGGAAPCGGIVLLSHLLGTGELQPEDLEE